ncbi:vacuolar protein sorting-associated protein 13 [Caerostris extrusa]|uniref:Vacuolar protein sorting-associated protein 13 n=1 Tax=Caerostris extrusa TaxID=172846 RepID=A0AAV4X0Q6_CAEEX|nr:vacuolar protein sorting-associated protein 13 [Caerostris extrusa]
MRLKEGDSEVFYDFDPRKAQEVSLEVGQYIGLQWHGKMSVSGDTEELHPVSMSPETDTGGGNRHLALHVHVTRDRSMDLYLFSPYWIINKTGLPLQFRGSLSDAVYEATSSTDPVLFRFKKHRKKKAKLRVYSSQWSKSFSLDTVGNCGVVICVDKERNKKYHFFVKVEMSKMLLTKVVVIKPFFLVINNTDNHLRFMEKNEATDLWFDIAPDKSGLKVVVKNGEDFPTTIAFHSYVPGDAPVRVDNYCEDLFLKINQKSQSQVTLLNPYQSVLYTWDDPSQERTLIWNLYNRKRIGFPARITRDGYGFEKVSFHSIRKTLVQQPSLRTSSMEQSSSSDDDSESEDGIFAEEDTKRQGCCALGVLCRKRAETYASLTPCPAIWEIEINHSWKLLTLELSAWLEDKWNADMQKAQLKDYLQVELSKMQMIKPFFGQLRRFYSPALFAPTRKSPLTKPYAHLKIHRFQVDNQLPDAVFPTVLHPGTTPQYVVRRNGPKPFFSKVRYYYIHLETRKLSRALYLFKDKIFKGRLPWKIG